MALTTIERELLNQAYRVIARGTHVHLCYALGTACHELGNNTPKQATYFAATQRLRKHIMTSLAPHATLDDWIKERVVDGKAAPDAIPYSKEDRSEARLGWIRWMLGTGKRYQPPVSPAIQPLDLSRGIAINSPRDSRPVKVGRPLGWL